MSLYNCVRFTEYVTLVPSSGGARILGAVDATAQDIGHDITVTAGSNGTHSGPDDPHYKGNAFDLRTHDLPNPTAALWTLRHRLGPAFYAFIEDPGVANEHIHVQVAKGTTFPPEPQETTT